MKLTMLQIARRELLDAIRYYNEQREGLGYELASEFKNVIFRIIDFPEAWPRLSERSRRCLMNRFPYAVLYRHKSDRILIVAVMNMSRDPQRWQDRI